MKRTVLILMILCCLLPLLAGQPAHAQVLDSGTQNGISWSLTDDGVLTVSGQGDIPGWFSPWYYSHRSTIRKAVIQEGITGIGAHCFAYLDAMTQVVLPETLTSIGQEAFYFCEALEAISIPDGVERIGSYAFGYCSKLAAVSLGSGVQVIGESAFNGCLALTEILFPAGLVRIEQEAFCGCEKLSRAEFSGSVYSIGEQAFYGCKALKRIALPDTLSELGGSVFIDCEALEEVILPGNLTQLPSHLFYLCKALKTVTLPQGLTTIGESAFSFCDLEQLTLPASVTDIGENAFYGCERLTEVTAEGPLQRIGEAAFSQCRELSTVDLSGGIGEIGPCAFACAENLTVIFPATPPALAEDAFYCSNVTAFYPANATQWTQELFLEHGGYWAIWLPYNPGEALILGSGTCGAGLSWELTLEGVLTVRGTGPMDDWEDSDTVPWCNLRPKILSVVLESGITSVGEDAFYLCENLSSVQLPETVRTVGSYAFSNCYLLRELALPEGLTELKDYAFYYSGLRTVRIPRSVTVLPDGLFSQCSALEEVILHDGITHIGAYAFWYCTSLARIELPDGVTFGSSAFRFCDALKQQYETQRTQLALGTEYPGAIEIPDLYTLYYEFTPESDERYAFRSQGNADNLATLYDSTLNPLATDDDSGQDTNFSLAYTLEAGKTYILGITLHDTSKAASFRVRVEVSHDHVQTTVQEATCSEPGTGEFRCSFCGDAYTTQLPAGHRYRGGSCELCGQAEEYPLTVTESAGDGSRSRNKDKQSYSRWYSAITSTLAEEEDGYLRVEYARQQLVIERYDKAYSLISSQTLALELPTFGGVYIGQDYNFLVCGQNNYGDSDEVEVIRIIRYTKDWERCGSASIFGANTYEPFRAGSLRFARVEDMLYIRTCHEMYLSGDGKHHQANMTIALYIPDMAVTDLHCLVSASGAGYVSHSFNQFIVADGSDMVFADHGDAYPRSVVLHLSEGAAGKRTLPQLHLPEVDSLPIAENTGHYNGTGVNVGGMLCSDTHYIVVGKTCDQSGGIDQDKAQKNIFVAATPKDSFTDEATVRHFLTDYAADANVAVSAPHLVQLERNRFLILWTAEGKLHYCILDGQGQRTSQVFTCEGALSDCVPILSDGRVIWYVTENSAPVFYAIELNYIADAPHKHQLRTTMVTQPGTQPGLVRLTCTGCELVEELTLPALDSQEYRVDIETAPGCTESGEARYTWPTPYGSDISFTAPLPPTGHLYKDGTCAHCGEEEPTFTLGDVNGDGKINVTDAMVTLRYAVKKITANELILEAADVTGDGKVNVTDAMQILRYAVKKITQFQIAK